MSHSRIQYIKPPGKIWTPGSAGTLATARTPSTAGKLVTAGPPATACWKGTAGMPTTPLVTPGTSAIAERPATGNHQELKGHQQLQECLPLMQATAVTQETIVAPATSNIKNDSSIMTA
jgi:hypothetical protein